MGSNYASYVASNAQIVGGALSGNPMMIVNGVNGSMGFLSNLFGNLFGSGSSSNATQRLNRDDTDWMYQKQSDYWKQNTQWYNAEGYKMLRQGLEAAGYNPLMALGASPMNGATVTGSAMDSDSRSFSYNLPKSIMQAISDVRNTNADTMLKGAMTEENISRSNLENAQKILHDSAIPYADRKNEAETLSIEIENRRKEAEINKIQAETSESFSRRDLNRIEARYKRILSQMSVEQAKYFRAIVNKLSSDIELSSSERAWIRNNPEVAQFLSGVRHFGQAFGSILHAVNINSYETINVK